MRKKVLILCHDTIGAKMAGPGIRYKNIARVLEKHVDVTLAVQNRVGGEVEPGLAVVNPDNDDYKQIFDNHDVIFAQWLSQEMLMYAKEKAKAVVIDLYAPVPIEYLASLEFSADKLGPEQDLEFRNILDMYNNYFDKADLFTCSNERQKDFWIGYLTANGRLLPTNFGKDNILSKLVLCPMGVESAPPAPKVLRLRESLALDQKDFILLWTGGIWDWFDAKLIVEAMSLIGDPSIKLVFMGTKHPNSNIGEMKESKAARSLSDKLKLTGKSVYFLDGWVPYDERDAFLLDADASVYADKESLETRFSHRTRVLDHFWSLLPTICSRGDYLSSVIEQKGLGVVVPERDAKSFSEAIIRFKGDDRLRKRVAENLSKERSTFTWEATLHPLVEYIANMDPTKIIPVPKDIAQSVALSTSKKRRLKNSIKVLLGRIDV